MKRFFSVFCFLCTVLILAGPGKKDKFRIDFTSATFNDEGGIPSGWMFSSKVFVEKPEYRILRDPVTKTEFLRVNCGKSHSGAIIFGLYDVLQHYPVMRWKWRVNRLPSGADGRTKLDDQAISIYVGAGSPRRSSVAYRWETDTPKGYRGRMSYAAGFVRTVWYAVRNKKDGTGIWLVEERDVGADFKEAYGYVPAASALSIVANAQYTKSGSSADIEYIEFHPRKKKK